MLTKKRVFLQELKLGVNLECFISCFYVKDITVAHVDLINLFREYSLENCHCILAWKQLKLQQFLLSTFEESIIVYEVYFHTICLFISQSINISTVQNPKELITYGGSGKIL